MANQATNIRKILVIKLQANIPNAKQSLYTPWRRLGGEEV
jgi:hypothetical protein